jgi:hypothetical protein
MLWVYVEAENGGIPITNASFGGISNLNDDDGWYYLHAGESVKVTVSAPGYLNAIFNTGDYESVAVVLNSPPPPPPSNCWS